jgi:serine/threonine-protein kinase
MALIFIPAGPFPMGSDQGDPDEKPVHIVTLSDYWIDQTEVTNAMYARCVQAGVCQPPRKTASATRSDYYDNTLYANYPMLQVKWEMASRYCAWARRRLPSEAEWEKAARGPDGRTYPWGEAAPDATRLNFNNLLGDTAPVASYPLTGASPYAIHDLAGNAWEWVNDYYDPNYYQASPASNPPGPTQGSTRILRGGSWNNYGYYVRAASRSAAAPDDLDGTGYGFRCASTQP